MWKSKFNNWWNVIKLNDIRFRGNRLVQLIAVDRFETLHCIAMQYSTCTVYKYSTCSLVIPISCRAYCWAMLDVHSQEKVHVRRKSIGFRAMQQNRRNDSIVFFPNYVQFHKTAVVEKSV